MSEAQIEAKKTVLKSLASKMYKMEMDSYKKGDAPKPKAVPNAMKQTKTDEKKETPKISNKVKDMVKGFFNEAKPKDDAYTTGFVKRKNLKVVPKEMAAKPKRKRVRKKA